MNRAPINSLALQHGLRARSAVAPLPGPGLNTERLNAATVNARCAVSSARPIPSPGPGLNAMRINLGALNTARPSAPEAPEPLEDNLSGRVTADGAGIAAVVRAIDLSSGLLLQTFACDALGYWSGYLEHERPFVLLIHDPQHAYASAAAGPYQLPAT
jgi:hypothetical protein